MGGGGNIGLIKFMLLIPMLFTAFWIDIKKQIIPNRLNLNMFYIGIIFAFIMGITNLNIGINMILRRTSWSRSIFTNNLTSEAY